MRDSDNFKIITASRMEKANKLTFGEIWNYPDVFGGNLV